MKKSALLAACLAALIVATLAIASVATRDGSATAQAAQPAHPQANFATPF